jgi:hypothetical protein
MRGRLRAAFVVLALAVGIIGAGAQPASAFFHNTPRTITLTPLADVNTVGDQHCVTATVRNILLGGVPNQTVTFTVSGANAQTGTRVTNSSGTATYCYTGTTVGLDTITARSGSLTSNPVTKVWIPGATTSLVVNPAADTNTVGTEHCVTATARNIFGFRVGGITVRFNVAGTTTTSGSAVTNSQGEARFCYTSETAGADVITSYADNDGDGQQDPGEPVGVATKVWVAGAPNTVDLDPKTDVNEAGQEHCVTANVTDEFGNPNAGETVVFTVTGANDAGGTAQTNGAGTATFCYTGTQAGVDTIRAFVDRDDDGQQDPGEPFDVATKVYEPAEPATVTVDPPADENQAGDEHCVTATVRDRFGNPVEGVNVDFTVSGTHDEDGTDTTDEAGQAEFCYTGTLVGVDVIRAHADTDDDNTEDPGEPIGLAEKTWQPGDPAAVVLTPAADVNPVGTQHCVTADVVDAFGNPAPDVLVRFEVTGSVTTDGSARTDEEGHAEFCYQGPILPGADVIRAYADTDEDNTQDPTEPSGAAEKTWVFPVSTPGCEVNDGGMIVADNGDRATFGGTAKSDRSHIGEQEYQDHGPATEFTFKSTEVIALVCLPDGSQADIYGSGTVETGGGNDTESEEVDYRIQVRDGGEGGGTQDTYRITLSNGYDSGEQPLIGGNIQIRTGEE